MNTPSARARRADQAIRSLATALEDHRPTTMTGVVSYVDISPEGNPVAFVDIGGGEVVEATYGSAAGSFFPGARVLIEQSVSGYRVLESRPSFDPPPPVPEPDPDPEPEPDPEIVVDGNWAASGTSGTVSLNPSGISSGDVLLAMGFNIAVSDPASVPAGWTHLGDAYLFGNLSAHVFAAAGSTLLSNGGVSYGTSYLAALHMWRVQGITLSALQQAVVTQFTGGGPTVAMGSFTLSEGEGLFSASLMDGNPGTTYEFDQALTETVVNGNSDRTLGGHITAPVGGGGIGSTAYSITEDSSLSIYGFVVELTPDSAPSTGTPTDPTQNPGAGAGDTGGRLMFAVGAEGNTGGSDIISFDETYGRVDGMFHFSHLATFPSDTTSTLGSPNQGNENFPVGQVEYQITTLPRQTSWFECTLQGRRGGTWATGWTYPITSYLDGPGGASGQLLPDYSNWLDNFVAGLIFVLDRHTDLNVTIRLLHEFNGHTWVPWHIGENREHSAVYAEVFRKIHSYITNSIGAVRKERVFFSWSPNNWVKNASGYAPTDPSLAYPGTDYVDFFAPSLYHGAWAGNSPVVGTAVDSYEEKFRLFATEIDANGYSSGLVRMAIGEGGIATAEGEKSPQINGLWGLAIDYQFAYYNWFYFDSKPGEPDFTMRSASAAERQAYVDGIAAWRVATADGGTGEGGEGGNTGSGSNGGSSGTGLAVFAGPDTTVETGAEIQLIGQVTNGDFRTKPYADATRLWTQASGPGTAVFGDATREFSRVTFPVDGTYVLQLTADDGSQVISDTVTFEAIPNIESRVTQRKEAMLTYLRSLKGTPNFVIGQQGVFGRNQYRNVPLAGGDSLDGPVNNLPDGNALSDGAVWPYDNGGAMWDILRDGAEAWDTVTDIPDNPFGPGGIPYPRLQLADGDTSAAFPATGREPAFLGADISGWTGAVADFFIDTDQAVHAVIDHWHRGGISHVGMQFWPSPLRNLARTSGQFASDADVDLILPGGSERSVWTGDMDLMVDALLRLQHHGIPVVWRPFGECNGTFKDGRNDIPGATPFWWQYGRPSVGEIFVTPTKSNQLWSDMVDYFWNAGVRNIVWAWTPLYWNTTASFNSSLAGSPQGATTYVPRFVGSSGAFAANEEICEIIGFSQYVGPNNGYSAGYVAPCYTAFNQMVAAGEISSDRVWWIPEMGFGEHGSGVHTVPADLEVAAQQVSNMQPNLSIVSHWVSNGVDLNKPPGSTGVIESFAMYGIASQTGAPGYMNRSTSVTLGELPNSIFA